MYSRPDRHNHRMQSLEYFQAVAAEAEGGANKKAKK